MTRLAFNPPAVFTSGHVLAEFYRRARNVNIEVFIDYEGRTKFGKKCRFNGVLVVGKEIVAIVVCKRSPNAARGPTRQRTRYESFGVPVIIVRGMDRIPAAVEEARKIVLAAGQPLSDQELEDLGLLDGPP